MKEVTQVDVGVVARDHIQTQPDHVDPYESIISSRPQLAEDSDEKKGLSRKQLEFQKFLT